MVRKNKIKSLLLGSAVGDALGVPFEFKARGSFICTDMVGYGSHKQPIGTWSDDTSLTLCLAEQIAEGFDMKALGKKFVDWVENGYMTAHGDIFDIGYGTNQAILNLAYNVCDPKDAGSKDYNNNGNGSLMRIAPLVFLIGGKTETEVKKLVSDVSSMTHGHKISVECCYLYIRFLEMLLNGVEKHEAFEKIRSNFNLPYVTEQTENTVRSGGFVVDTLNASLWCFLTTDNYKDAVLKAVNLGGDTDTTACVTGAIAGLYYGEESIPKEWLDKLAKREMIEDIADRMAEKL